MQSIFDKAFRLGIIFGPKSGDDPAGKTLERLCREDVRVNLKENPASQILVPDNDASRSMLEDVSVNAAHSAMDSLLERVTTAPISTGEQTIALYFALNTLSSITQIVMNGSKEAMAEFAAHAATQEMKNLSGEEQGEKLRELIQKISDTARASDETERD